jgi:hypothetical protein
VWLSLPLKFQHHTYMKACIILTDMHKIKHCNIQYTIVHQEDNGLRVCKLSFANVMFGTYRQLTKIYIAL